MDRLDKLKALLAKFDETNADFVDLQETADLTLLFLLLQAQEEKIA